MRFQNTWAKAQYYAETPQEYIAAGIAWQLEDTGELADINNQLMVAYGPNGCDDMFMEKFGPQTREQIEQILVKIMLKNLADRY